MTVTEALLLMVAGVAAGTVNAVAGGGSLITFPTLVGIGLSTKAANVSNSIAVVPGYLGSVYGSRSDLAALAASRGRGLMLGLLPTAVLGSVAGCLLLLGTPTAAFDVVVPFLVLGATAVLAFQQRLRGVVGQPHRMSRVRQVAMLHGMVGLASVYGGYFGAALGVMLVAALGLVLDESLARISALKNAISAVVGAVTVLVFALFGPVNWATVAVITPATLVGGYGGARLVRRLPNAVLRGLIVILGTVVGIILLVRGLG